MALVQPDIVLVMTDEQRYDQVGFASGGYYETPHLDGLARDGAIFTAAHSASTTCAPSRNALLTGVQPHRLPHQYTRYLKEGVWTVAHALRDAGYQTALIGKMHFVPIHGAHGFDVMRTCEHLRVTRHQLRADGSPDLDDYHQWLVDEGLASWGTLVPGERPRIRKVKGVRRSKAPEAPSDAPFPYGLRYHPTSWIEREAVELLTTRDRSRPLFLVVSFPHPHGPLNPLEPYRSMYDPEGARLPTDGFEVNEGLPKPFLDAMRGARSRGRGASFGPRLIAEGPRLIAKGPRLVAEEGEASLRRKLTAVRALIRHIDDALGRVLAHLERDRSVVIFTSDHGDYAGHRGLLGKVPWIPFDDLLRVPLVMAGPGIERQRLVDAQVQTIDLPLTCCALAGVDVPTDEFDSRSLLPFVTSGDGGDAGDRALVFATNLWWPGARRGRYKLFRFKETPVLFDLAEDPGETTNRASDATLRDVRENLEATLDAALARPTPPFDWFSPTVASSPS